MSRNLRQASQLARLVRYSTPHTFQRRLRPSTIARSAPASLSATSYGFQLRHYASKPPNSKNDPNSKKAKKPESGKQAAGQHGKAQDTEGSQPKKFPLPEGWIRLTADEITQLEKFSEGLPVGPKEAHAEVLKAVEQTGVPGEARHLLEQLRRGEQLSLMDKGRLMRCIYQIADRLATLEIQGESVAPKGSNFFKGNGPSQENKDTGAKSGEKGKDGQPKGNPNKDDPKPKSFTFTTDITTTILAFFVIYLMTGAFSGGAEKEITWQEVRRSFLDKGLVQKFVVVDGSRVRVELHPEAAQASESGSRSTLYFSIGSVESFENHLEEAQDQLGIPPAERIPVSFASSGSSLGNLFLAFGPTILFIGLILYTQRSMGGGRVGGSGGVFNFGKSKAKRFNAESAVQVKFSDVAGMEEAKTEIMEFVSFLKNPEKFEKLGAKIPRGAILAGPPGTGKTLLAKATAGESGVPFFSVSGSEFVEMFVGVGSSRVRDLFAEGRKNAPCIIFIDEIDAIGRARQESGRGFGGNDEREATLNQILTEMDGFNSREQVVVLAGTNRADVLDKALMRPGRFDRHIYIDRPTTKGRQEIFHVYLKKIVTKEDVDHLVGRLATLTPGFSGADIANVVNEAALIGTLNLHLETHKISTSD